jgi:hypothetical protein
VGLLVLLEEVFELKFVEFALDFKFDVTPVCGLGAETRVFEDEFDFVVEFFEVFV